MASDKSLILENAVGHLYGEVKTIEVVVKDLWLLGLDRKVRIVVTKIGSNR